MSEASKSIANKRWIRNATIVLIADILIVWFSFLFALLLRFDFKVSSIPTHFVMEYV